MLKYEGIEYNRTENVGPFIFYGNETGEDTFNHLIVEYTSDGYMIHMHHGGIKALGECIEQLGSESALTEIRSLMEGGSRLPNVNVVDLEKVER